MNTQMKNRLFRILDFIAAFVFSISFLNINIQVSNDVIVSIWNYIWNPDKQYVLMTIVSYIGILLLWMPYIPILKTKLIKPKYLSYLGLAILWIVILIFLPDLWDWQRHVILNYQYAFILSTFVLISDESICIRLNKRNNNDKIQKRPSTQQYI